MKRTGAMTIGTKITVATQPGSSAIQKARVVRTPEADPRLFGVYIKLNDRRFAERTDNEGISWCRGWSGAQVEALQVTAALLPEAEVSFSAMSGSLGQSMHVQWKTNYRWKPVRRQKRNKRWTKRRRGKV